MSRRLVDIGGTNLVRQEAKASCPAAVRCLGEIYTHLDIALKENA